MRIKNDNTLRRGVNLSLGSTVLDAKNQSEAETMSEKTAVPTGITLATLAEHKGLPEQFLQSIGVSDNPEKPGEVLVHYDQANNELAKMHRIRTALTATEADGWTRQQIGPIVPYGLGRLSDVEKQGYLVLVNGESDCWTLWHHGFPALGIPGAKMITSLEAEHLASVPKIYVVKEANKAGGVFVAAVAKRLQKIGWAGQAFVVAMPKGIKDPNELHKRDSAAFSEKFQALIDAAEPIHLDEGDNSARESDRDDKRSPVEILIDLAVKKCKLFHTRSGDAYASIDLDGHTETWAVTSPTFRLWLQREFYRDQKGKVPNAENLQAVLNHLHARANFDGPTEEVFTRVAEIGETIYLDLCDEKWRAVEITVSGWRVIDNAPVHFRRAKGMLSLPEPEKGGSLETFRKLIKMSDGDDWVLLLGWMAQALRPKGPYPILCFQGEQGVAKTTTGRVVRALIDPASPPDRTLPHDERDLMIGASNSWILSMDNLSGNPAVAFRCTLPPVHRRRFCHSKSLYQLRGGYF